MPFITQDDLLKQQQQGQTQGQGQGQIVGQDANTQAPQGSTPQSQSADPTKTISQGSTGAIVGSSGGGATAQGAGPQSSGSYTNLQDYLSANKDNAATLGQNVGNQIRSVGQDASNQINDSSNQFGQQVQKNTLSNLDSASQDAQGIVSKANSTNQGQSVSANDLSRFKDISTANYQGPKTFQDANVYQPAYDKVQKVGQEANLANSDSGRSALLQQVYNRPDYTTGQNNLDGLLLNGSQEGRGQLAQARQDVSGIGQQFQSAQDQGAAQASQIAQQTAQAKQDALGNFNTTRDATTGQVQSRLDDVKNHWSDAYNDLNTTLKNYKGGDLNLTPNQAKELGVMDNGRVYNMLNATDPAQYLKQNTYDAGKIVSGDEQAKLAALDQLASQAGLSQTNKYTNASSAGTQSLQDALDARAFGTTQQQRQKDFQDYAATANEAGHGHGERDIQQDYGFGKNTTGSASSDLDVSQTLADSIAGGTNVQENHSGTWTPANAGSIAVGIGSGGLAVIPQYLGSGRGEAQGRADADAKKFAYESLQAAITADRARQGYDNQIKIGSGPGYGK